MTRLLEQLERRTKRKPASMRFEHYLTYCSVVWPESAPLVRRIRSKFLGMD